MVIQYSWSFLFFFILSLTTTNLAIAPDVNSPSTHDLTSFPVGVILDLDSVEGKVGWSCISMALDDFYRVHENYATRMVFYPKNSKGNVVGAAFAALDLLRNEEVGAIIGPQKSIETDCVINLGDQAQVPIISFSATSPSLSLRSPYFVQSAQNDSSQVSAIIAIVQAFQWREVVLIYEVSEYGHGIVPYLVNAFQEVEIRVPHRSIIPLSASDYQIRKELDKLEKLHNRVFVVHMSYSLGSRFFLMAKEAGMMSEGYAWITTEGITDVINFMDSNVVSAMQGVLGVRPYIPISNELSDFKIRWEKKFHQQNPNLDRAELNVHGLWAYDTVWALAMAVETVGVTIGVTEINSRSKLTSSISDSTTISISQSGAKLLEVVSNLKFKGLSGDFHLLNGQLQPSIFEIINVVVRKGKRVGFWSPKHGISREWDVTTTDHRMYTTLRTSFGGIIWPGDTTFLPKGWVIPSSGKKLQIGVPHTDGFNDFVKLEHDPQTNKTIVKGYSIEVFKAVVDVLPYALPYEFIPFEIRHGVGSYDDMIYQVYLQKYDAVVGGTTITANRSLYVDFTLPYTGGGVSMIVSIEHVEHKSAWVFLYPLTKELWFTSIIFFIGTGIVVWVLEHRINEEFRGPAAQQFGMIFWFPLSTLVFAHQKVVGNLARLVVIVWVFFVLILTSSYTASLSSMFTVERLRPAVTNVQDLIRSGDYVGYQQGSFMPNFLKRMNFDESKLKSINSPADLDEALSKGSQNGGISAFFEVTPYIEQFVAKYCNKYIVVGPINKTDGFGFGNWFQATEHITITNGFKLIKRLQFIIIGVEIQFMLYFIGFCHFLPMFSFIHEVFPRGSPLVSEISRAILNITEGKKIIEIDRVRFGIDGACSQSGKDNSSTLSVTRIWGLLLVTGSVSSLALSVFLLKFLYKHGNILIKPTDTGDTFWKRVQEFWAKFDDRASTFDDFNSKVRILKPFVKEIEDAVARALAAVPVIRMPIVDAPVPDMPVVDAPDAPVPDVTIAAAPTVEMQAAAAPIVEMQAADAPAPVLEVPAILEVPVLGMPPQDAPVKEVPAQTVQVLNIALDDLDVPVEAALAQDAPALDTPAPTL